MTEKQLHMVLEEFEHAPRFLILGNDFPILTQKVIEILNDRGCRILYKATKQSSIDYCIIFKKTKKTDKILPLLKPGGKALIVVDEQTEENRLPFPVFTIAATKSFSGETLARSLLQKLFAGSPLVSATPSSSTTQSKKNKRRSHKLFRLFMTILLLFFLISIPFVVFAGATLYTVYQLQTIRSFDVPLEAQQDHVTKAKTGLLIAQYTLPVIKPILAPFPPVLMTLFDASWGIVTNLTTISDEALGLERIVASGGKELFNDPSGYLSTHMPDITSKLTSIERYLENAEISYLTLTRYKQYPLVSRALPSLETIPALRRAVEKTKQALMIIPALLPSEGEKKYVLLLQNNFELRPTGGFIGSFAILTVTKGRIADITIHDVYEADGQLKGKVDPPVPIERYLHQPNWYLRDSNWNPDFAFSANQAEWFLQKELGKQFDGVFAIDLYFLQYLLRALGGVYVPDYQASVTADDFFLKLQADHQEEFFPGSSKKRDLITALVSALRITFTEGKLPPLPLLKALYQSLEEKHLLFYLHDTNVQNRIEQLGWGGRLVTPATQTTAANPYVHDYTMLVESNVGVNKVNYQIRRELFTTITLSEQLLTHTVLLYYKNESGKNDSLFSGRYANYLRILIPTDAQLSQAKDGDTVIPRDQITIDQLNDKQSVGMFIEVVPQEEKKITIMYTIPLPRTKEFTYQLMLQKQPGTDRDPFVFKLDSTIWNVRSSNVSSLPYLSDLKTDRLISVDFEQKIR
ncbi:DUF4012 domain-containing protein [Candidatus Roizmanbacteria bacterium]|nr:DUF4012 domain-containing protein [Candidatus Roizmanbacteria bacterium]